MIFFWVPGAVALNRNYPPPTCRKVVPLQFNSSITHRCTAGGARARDHVHGDIRDVCAIESLYMTHFARRKLHAHNSLPTNLCDTRSHTLPLSLSLALARSVVSSLCLSFSLSLTGLARTQNGERKAISSYNTFNDRAIFYLLLLTLVLWQPRRQRRRQRCDRFADEVCATRLGAIAPTQTAITHAHPRTHTASERKLPRSILSVYTLVVARPRRRRRRQRRRRLCATYPSAAPRVRLY